MKTIIITFFCLLFYQDNGNIFKINNLSNQYKRNETIKFSIKNNSKNKVIYFVSLFIYDSGWREAISDVDNPSNKIIRYSKLEPNKNEFKKISIKKTFYFLDKINFKNYKLAIIYNIENDTTKRIQFSNSFVIKD